MHLDHVEDLIDFQVVSVELPDGKVRGAKLWRKLICRIINGELDHRDTETAKLVLKTERI
jgi:hypothetical protein